MRGLYIEERTVSDNKQLAWDLAHHMYTRVRWGKIAVITDRPVELLSTTRKQWLRLMRQVQRERSSTLNVMRLAELGEQIAAMDVATFSSRPYEDVLEAAITFGKADDFIQVAPICQTLYVACELEREKLYSLTTWIGQGGVAILYTL